MDRHRRELNLNETTDLVDFSDQSGIVHASTENVPKTIRNLTAVVGLDGAQAFGTLLNLIRMLGGNAKWDVARGKWFVKHEGKTYQFFGEKDLKA